MRPQLDFLTTNGSCQSVRESVLSTISFLLLPWINQWFSLIEWVIELYVSHGKKIPASIIFLQLSYMFYFHLSILELHYLNLRFQRWICCRYCRTPSLIDLGCLPASFKMLHFYLYKMGLYPVNCHTLSSPHFLSKKLVFSSLSLSEDFNSIKKIFPYIYVPWNSILHIYSFSWSPFWIH